jgi:hypothetical protein
MKLDRKQIEKNVKENDWAMTVDELAGIDKITKG